MNILFIALSSKYARGALGGAIAGFIIGSYWVGKEQDEMMRQMVQVLRIAGGR